MSHILKIEYCRMCRWTLRAFYLAQEVLQTFEEDFQDIHLRAATAGQFQVKVNDTLVWCRKQDGGFPEPKVLKQRIRDCIDPDRNLGHNDPRPN